MSSGDKIWIDDIREPDGRIDLGDGVYFSKEVPEIYQRLHDIFGVEWKDGIIITYGDTVYSKEMITKDLIVHEKTHVRQQAEVGVEEWWANYIHDVGFRRSQEGDAYRNQWQYLKSTLKDRERLFRKRLYIIRALSSSTYGNCCTTQEADKIIGL